MATATAVTATSMHDARDTASSSPLPISSSSFSTLRNEAAQACPTVADLTAAMIVLKMDDDSDGRTHDRRYLTRQSQDDMGGVKTRSRLNNPFADINTAFSPSASKNKSTDGSAIPRIDTISKLKREMEGMCQTVFDALGKQQPESAYQRALAIELRRQGVAVALEVPVPIVYRGEQISSRRIDLLLKLADGSSAIVEMKAISSLTKGKNNAAQQVGYYLDVFGVHHGFLVNFPHDTGFPPPPSGAVFLQEPLCGVTGPLSDVRLRGSSGGAKGGGERPEIVYFKRAREASGAL